MPRVTKKDENIKDEKIKKTNTTKKGTKTTKSDKDTTKTAKSTKKTKETTPKKVTKTTTVKKTTKVAAPKKTTKTVKSDKTKKVTKKTTHTSKLKTPILSEHYDLPNSYNTTFISLLAQSPKILFVFWEISQTDITNLMDKYGSYFFENTRPVLKIINKTNNSSFEIEINDYATNWYIEVENSNCEFEVQLGRRPSSGYISDDFIIITTSNSLISPNDHILLEQLPQTFQFKNVKTNEIIEKELELFNFSKIYNIYDFYKKMYRDELLNNPSSK